MIADPNASRPARVWLRTAWVSLWICAFTATHIPASAAPELPAGDAALHAVGYFGLTALFVLTLAAYGRARRRRIVTAVVTMAAYAAFDELTQPLVSRYAAWGDWLADFVGAAAAVAATEVLFGLWARRRGAA